MFWENFILNVLMELHWKIELGFVVSPLPSPHLILRSIVSWSHPDLSPPCSLWLEAGIPRPCLAKPHFSFVTQLRSTSSWRRRWSSLCGTLPPWLPVVLTTADLPVWAVPEGRHHALTVFVPPVLSTVFGTEVALNKCLWIKGVNMPTVSPGS